MVEKVARGPQHTPSATRGDSRLLSDLSPNPGPPSVGGSREDPKEHKPIPKAAAWPAGGLTQADCSDPQGASPVTRPSQESDHRAPGDGAARPTPVPPLPRSEGVASPRAPRPTPEQLSSRSTARLPAPATGRDGTGRPPPQDPACARSQAGSEPRRTARLCPGRRPSGRQSGTGRLASPSRTVVPILHD